MTYFILIISILLILLILRKSKNKTKKGSKLEDAFEFTKEESHVEEEVVLNKKEIKNQEMELQLIRAGLPLKAREFRLLKTGSMLLVLIVVYFLTRNIILGVMLSFAWSFIPKIILKFATEKKRTALEAQIPAALSLIRNSLEAGMSFLQALEIVAEEVDPPIGEEFARVLHETKLGKDISVALLNMLNRVDSRELKLVVIAVLIQKQVGGNLGEIIDVILETIKDRIQIKGEIRTLTSQGRLSAMVITCLPIFLGIIMYFMNPEYMTPLFTTIFGQILLGIAGCMMGLGVFMISKIIKIDF